MKKNMKDDVELQTQLKFSGNWNYRDPTSEKICSKPMGVVKLQDDEYVWKHDEIMKLLDLYFDADEFAINMIKSQNVSTGSVTHAEISFLEKVQQWINSKKAPTKKSMLLPEDE